MTDAYVHGYSEEERRRLTLMQSLLNDAELREFDLRGVRTVLDVGSGLGQMARAIARAAGEGCRVVGVEQSATQREGAARLAERDDDGGRVEFRAGDATALPLTDDERGTFDLAHARFLLEHVPDPLAVVRAMVGAVRPGGRVVLIDDDHDLLRFSPDCPEAETYWRVYWEAYRDRGQDPLVGRRLPQLLHRAGARDLNVRSIFYGACRGMPLFDGVVDNLVGVLRGAAESLVAAGKTPPDAIEDVERALADWRTDPAATVWYTLPLAEGTRPR